MTIRNLIIAIVCLVLLIASHWFAYHRGEKNGKEAFRSFAYQGFDKVAFRKLRSHVAMLRVMVKHPDRFSQREIGEMRLKGKLALIGGERHALSRFKETGDETRAQEVQSLLDEGRELLAKLPPSEKQK